jgi:hypothetical protein
VKRTTAFWVIVCVLALVAGCGGEKKEGDVSQAGGKEVQDKGIAAGGDSIAKGSVPRRIPKLYGAPLDTLRAKKARFEITLDQYWEERGGVLGNDYFEVWYPEGNATVTHGMYVFEELMPARETLEQFFGEAPRELLVIHCPPDLDAYKRDTGREWWYYSEIKGDSMTFAPVWILSERGISALALPHEYYQWAVRKITRDGAPRWLEEGLASYLSGEGDLLLNQLQEFAGSDMSMTPDRIEAVLQGEQDRRDSRVAYYHSYKMVKQLMDTYGEDRVKQVVTLIGTGKTLDQAFMAAVGKNYSAVLEDATRYTLDLPRKKKS